MDPMRDQKVLKQLQLESRIGRVASQLELARRYRTGVGAPHDLDKARYWFEQAATQGDEEGVYNLALMLLRGEGGNSDPEAGRALLIELAADSSLENARGWARQALLALRDHET